MQYQSLHHQAKHIDHLLDENIRLRGTLFLTREELEAVILGACPDFYVESFGWHKTVFGVKGLERKVVLKVGPKKSVENDHRAYKRVPENMRHQVFAKIFWHTKYCLLQEYGYPVHVTELQLQRLRREVNRYGIFDVKAQNLRAIDGAVKIIDANSTRIPLPTMLRKIDEIKPKLPKKLVSTLRKITSAQYER